MRGLVLIFFIAAGVASCKVNYTFTGAEIGDAKTISVEYITNKSGLAPPQSSLFLTEKLKTKFITETTLRLIDAGGDMHFSGVILDYTIAPVAVQGDAIASQNRLRIKAEITFENKTDKSKSFKQVFDNFIDFDANQNLAAIETSLMSEVLDMMVRDVFNKAVINW